MSSTVVRALRAQVWLALAFAVPVQAQNAVFPSRPVRLVVSMNAGNVSDVRARQIAERLAPRLGQPVIVDNRPGAGGEIAAGYVMQAPADGHTVLMGHIFSMTWNPHLTKQSINPVTAFAAITRVSSGPPILVAHPGLPVATVGELIAYANTYPGKLNMGGATGGLAHIALEMIRKATGATLHFVPYKGAGGQITSDLIANHIQLQFDFAVTLAPLIDTKRVKALGVASQRRLAALPDVPTFAESGYPGGLDIPSWQGLYARAGTPMTMLRRMASETANVLNLPEMRQVFESTGAEIGGDTPEQFGAYTLAEYERWGRIIRDAGIRLD